jgi:hypothetical protein
MGGVFEGRTSKIESFLNLKHGWEDNHHLGNDHVKVTHRARHWWLMPIILPTQEAQFRRITVHSQPK